MTVLRLRNAAIVAAAAIGLGGCATYSPYGYGSGLSVSIGSGYGGYGRYGGYGGYYDPFYDPYYTGYRTYYGSRYGSRYGGYYGSPYGGWYNGFYYPGFGSYVYDRYRQRVLWSNALRNYWSTRRVRLESSGVTNTAVTAMNSDTRVRVRRDRPASTRMVQVERSDGSTVQRSTRPTVERVRVTRTERTERRAERRAERAAERAARDDD